MNVFVSLPLTFSASFSLLLSRVKRERERKHKPHIISGPLHCQDTQFRVGKVISNKRNKRRNRQIKKRKIGNGGAQLGLPRAHGGFWQARVFGGVQAVSALGGDMVGQGGGRWGSRPSSISLRTRFKTPEGPNPAGQKPPSCSPYARGRGKDPTIVHSGRMAHTHTPNESNCQLSSLLRGILDLSACLRTRSDFRQVKKKKKKEREREGDRLSHFESEAEAHSRLAFREVFAVMCFPACLWYQ